MIGEEEEKEVHEELEAVDPEGEHQDDEEPELTSAIRADVDEMMKEFEDEVDSQRNRRPEVPGIVSMMLPQSLGPKQGDEMRSLERERTPR